MTTTFLTVYLILTYPVHYRGLHRATYGQLKSWKLLRLMDSKVCHGDSQVLVQVTAGLGFEG